MFNNYRVSNWDFHYVREIMKLPLINLENFILQKRFQIEDEKKIEDTDLNIVELKQENEDYDVKLKEYDDFLTTIDIEDLLTQKRDYDDFKKIYEDIQQNL